MTTGGTDCFQQLHVQILELWVRIELIGDTILKLASRIINSYRRSDPSHLRYRLILGIEHGPIAKEHMTKVERHQCLSSGTVCQSPFLSAVQIRPRLLSGFCWLALSLGIIPPRAAHDCDELG